MVPTMNDPPRNKSVISPIKFVNRNISGQIADHLEKLIMTGMLKPGERLPAERSLAEQLKVSRTSIREALSELESKQLIERTQGRGSTVLDPMSNTRKLAAMLESSDIELRNATELRESIEPRIAAFAAQRALPTHIAALQDILKMEADESLDQTKSMKLDVQFHLLLAHATNNKLLLTILQFTFKCTEHVRELSHQTPTGRRISHVGHQIIFEAVSSGNAQAAEHAMKRHLADVHDVSTLAK